MKQIKQYLPWSYIIIVSFVISPYSQYFGDTVSRVMGSLIGYFALSWILAFLSTMFNKKENNKETRARLLPYVMVVIATISLLGNLMNRGII